ncbi:hypothetical protein EVG20_g3429 [Dentipellis fragilis]|uniref:F-box domain-containing protein n=1 Tax=Dentipellis fragilis TaxID=205917 RepID=A0A4Y9Z600_9AGAM|nr:hypothetical protein EVG20_g3429 [Dentipellis fragilis]
MLPWRRNSSNERNGPSHSNEYFLQRLLARARRRELYTMLPNDVWVDGIFPHLSIRDIIRVRQVSKVLYELTHTPILWKNILRSVHFPLPPLPPTERYSYASLSSFETERLIVRGLNLDANWCGRKPTLECFEHNPVEAYHEVLSMKMVPGGHHMFASVRDFEENRYALVLFMMDHRVYNGYPIAKVATQSKAYHIQAKYMNYKGEMGIMVAYVRREPAYKADRMANVNVSEFSEAHDIDYPVPVRYEVVVEHINLKAISILEDPVHAPGSSEYREHVRTLDPPFRHVTSLSTNTSVDFLDLAEMNGDPYVFFGKRNQEIVQKNLTTRLVSRIHMPPLTVIAPPARAATTIHAMRVLSDQHQIIVVRTTTRVEPSPAELYLAGLEQPTAQNFDTFANLPADQDFLNLQEFAEDDPNHDDLGEDLEDEDLIDQDLADQGPANEDQPVKQHFTLEIYDLPVDGTTSNDFPQYIEMPTPSAMRSVCISEYISPKTYYHPSLLRKLSQHIEMPTISIYCIHEDPWQLLHLRLKPRRMPLHPPPPPPIPVDENGEPVEGAWPPLPSPPPPVGETIQRYSLTSDGFDYRPIQFSGEQDRALHIFPGATRCLLMGTMMDDRSVHPVPVSFFSYADMDIPTQDDIDADENWPYDKEQHEAAAAERAWIDAAYRQRGRSCPIRSLHPPLAYMFEDGVIASAWDEWSGRLCMVPAAEPQKIYVFEYAHAPREDVHGNRLPLPVHDVDVCKFFSDVIKDSAELQYLIQLTIEGVSETEGMPTHSVVAERLETLLGRRHGWNTMKWVKKSTITYRTYMPWSFADGIFLSMHDSSSHFVAVIDRLPTRGSEDGSRTCIELTGLKYAPAKIAHDATQDLLAFITRSDRVDDDPTEWYYLDLHLRSLRTGAAHPLAQMPRVECRFRTCHEHWTYQLRICGDFLALLRCDPEPYGDDNSYLRGWHWKAGDYFLYIESPDTTGTFPSFSDLAFLTPDVLLLSNPFPRGQIEVLTMGYKHLLTLQLPDYVSGWDIYLEAMTISCSAIADSHTSADAPPDDRIVSVTFQVILDEVPEASYICSTEISFRAQTVFHLLAAHGRHPPVVLPAATRPIVVPWDEWGPDGCRMFTLNRELRIDHDNRRIQRATHGMRAVRTLIGAPDRAQVLDFNITRHMGTSGAADPDAPSAELITEPITFEPIGVYQHEVVTKLPYAAIDIPNSEAYCGYLLDGQRLLGIKHRVENQPDQEIDVFVF